MEKQYPNMDQEELILSVATPAAESAPKWEELGTTTQSSDELFKKIHVPQAECEMKRLAALAALSDDVAKVNLCSPHIDWSFHLTVAPSDRWRPTHL